MGANIPESEQIESLKRLDFAYDEAEKTVMPPAVRIDIERPCDLAEEIARIYGYNRIESTVPKLASHNVLTPAEILKAKLINIMTAQGCRETMTFSFISPKSYEKCRIDESERKSVEIMNPLGEDTSVMRTSLIPSMMEVVARNINNRT